MLKVVFQLRSAGDSISKSTCFCCGSSVNCSQWVTNHHRDSIASSVGHYDMMAYLSAGENEAPGRIRFRMLEKLLQPCGPPPKLDMDEEERKLAAEQ